MRALFGSAIVLVLAAVPLDAQICTGLAPFGSRFRATGDAAFSDGVQAYGGSIGAATAGGLFANIGAGTLQYDDYDGSATLVGVDVGYQIQMDAARTIEVCPVASASLGFGPDDIPGFGDLSTRDYTLGASIGTLVNASPNLQIVPAGAIAFAYSWFEFEDAGATLDDSETYGLASIGIGFVLSRSFTIQPNVAVPFGLEDGEAVYGVSFALHFGAR